MTAAASPAIDAAWLLFLPQLGSEQGTLRVRLWRRLQALGAIALKNGAQLLPDTPACLEALQWLAGELQEAGGEASIARCQWLHGIDAGELRQRFNAERNREYDELILQLQTLPEGGERLARWAALERQWRRIHGRDHFGAERAAAAAALLADGQASSATPGRRRGLPPPGTRWVTRRNIGVDRITSAWLILRQIDPNARFRFVDDAKAKRRRDEVAFDMLDAEYGHREGRCTFEVLLDELGSADPALRRMAEMVHELDLGDERYPHPETAGLGILIRGLVQTHAKDASRLQQGLPLLDGFLAGLR